VLDTEIVGLVPQAALSPEDAEHVHLRGFDRQTRVLERLIEEAS
jgi:glutamate formiminotransferase